jgi:outer membrane protein assembly factor BamB
LLSLTFAFGQENWPQFRGEESLGVAKNPNLPTSWSTNKNVAWQANVPGMGWSSPIIWGDKIFVTSVVKDGEVEPPKKGLYFGGERPTPSKDTHHWMVYGFDWQTGKSSGSTRCTRGRPEIPSISRTLTLQKPP